MTPVLISVVAIGLAAFFAALVWRLKREEQVRSAARVAALSAAIDDATPPAASAEPVNVTPAFLSPDRPSSHQHGVLKLAAGFGIVVVAIVGVASLGSSRREPVAAAATAPAAGVSLELLSMRHAREGETLTVTGLVRNGGSGAARGLIAVVLAFDRSGNFLASGRAPLEVVSLGPGDESPFRVSVPDAGEVGRYRVSFRTEAGVVRHTDRRQALLADSGDQGNRLEP